MIVLPFFNFYHAILARKSSCIFAYLIPIQTIYGIVVIAQHKQVRGTWDMISASARKRSTFWINHIKSSYSFIFVFILPNLWLLHIQTSMHGFDTDLGYKYSVLALHYDEFCKVRAYIMWWSIRPTNVRWSNVANFTYRRRILWALLQISFSKDFRYTTVCVQWWYTHNDSSVDLDLW